MSGSFPQVTAIPDEALGNTSYLVALDETTAVSVDPRRDVAEHLAHAEQKGIRIEGVLETHLHADFVSGAREIADVTGADIFAAAEAPIAFPHTRVSPADPIVVGSATIRVLGTPGHTPEHIAFALDRAVFTGGSLIVGGAARTDLTGADRTDELARAQFASLRRLAELPDDTAVYPTHGAGSFCSTGAARSATTTIGNERGSNALFAITDEDEFVERIRAGYGSYPRYFAHLRDVNALGAPLQRALPSVLELTGHHAKEAVDRGAWLVDGRTPDEWARVHARGSVSIPVRAAFASWLGWVVPFGAPVVLLLDPSQLADALVLARRIGYDRIEGWTTMGSWRAAGLPMASAEILDPAEAAERSERGALLLDVRQDDEWRDGRAAGATHIELGDIITGKTPEASEVIAYCGHGERSITAASLLERRGVRASSVAGGIGAWRRAKLPLES